MKNVNVNIMPGNGWLDFHSHILPGMDDGAQHVAESQSMLETAGAQNVVGMVATPHYYAQKESPEAFLSRRKYAVSRLSEACACGVRPKLYLGAEVSFFNSMGQSKQLESLCIEGTKLLLVEMPMEIWSERTKEVLFAVRHQLQLIPMVAHLERYIDFQSKYTLEEFAENGIYAQINAESLGIRRTRKLCERMMMSGVEFVFGSDCHDSRRRPPNMETLARVLSKRAGDNELLNFAMVTGQRLLNDTDVTLA